LDPKTGALDFAQRR